MLCIQNIQTAYNPYQPFQHSLSCPLTVFLRQQCFLPNSPCFDAVDAVAVALAAAVLLAAVRVWYLLALLVGWLAACCLVLQLWWVGAALVGWLHLLVAASRPR